MSSSSTRAVHLEHVGLRTTAATFEPTIRLYTDVFGWRVIEERPSTGPDDRVSFLADGAGGAFEVFVSSSSAGVIDDPAHIAFAVPFADFDALAERLKQAGVTLDPPFINDVGDQISFFNDPPATAPRSSGGSRRCPRATPELHIHLEEGTTMQDAVRLEHVGIGATPETFDATLAFYMDLFGWRVHPRVALARARHAARLHRRWPRRRAGGLHRRRPAAGAPRAPGLRRAAGAVRRVEERLRAANVAIEGRTQNSAGDELGFFNDPSGNRAQIVGRIEALGTGGA